MDGRVQILNSHIFGRIPKKQIMPLAMKHLEFVNIATFEMYRETIYVRSARKVIFENCNLKVNDEFVIDIYADNVYIKNSKLRLNSKGDNNVIQFYLLITGKNSS